MLQRARTSATRRHPATSARATLELHGTVMPQNPTVVGGYTRSASLELHGRQADVAQLTLLSVRPEGPRHSVLSLLLAASSAVTKVALHSSCNDAARPAAIDISPCGRRSQWKSAEGAAAKDLYATPHLVLSIEGGPLLPCAWMVPISSYGGTSLLRVACASEQWVAFDAIRRGRMRAALNLTLAGSQTSQGKATVVRLSGVSLVASIPFTAEALDALPKPVSISACVDAAYYEGNPNKGDFDQWAIAMQLVGFERLYVPNQPYYYQQYRATALAKPGLVMFGFDVVHRYASGEELKSDQQTSFREIVEDLNADVAACLHEHWYDDWVFLSASTDEYFSFLHSNPSMLPKHPIKPTPLMGEYMQRYKSMLKVRHPTEEMPRDVLGRRWPCQSAACYTIRWYSARRGPNATKRAYIYEDPALNASQREHKRISVMQLNASNVEASLLSFETRTFRASWAPTHGAARKCAYHPDWRSSGPQMKIHGIVPDGCPSAGFLQRSKTCTSASRPALRTLCWELCGKWGNVTRNGHPRPRPFLGDANSTCGGSIKDRYETHIANNYRGHWKHVPACPRNSSAACTGPTLERAHMRGEDDAHEEARWLAGVGPTVRRELASILALSGRELKRTPGSPTRLRCGPSEHRGARWVRGERSGIDWCED